MTGHTDWQLAAAHRILLATDEHGTDELSRILAELPDTARGQVFVEVADIADVRELAVPRKVSVTWLVRTRGQSLVRAVDAWLSEMLPTSAFSESTVYAWIGADGSARLLTSS